MSAISLQGSDLLHRGLKFCQPQSSARRGRINRCVVRASSASPELQTVSTSRQTLKEANPERANESNRFHKPPGPEIPAQRSTELQFDKLQDAYQQDGSKLRKRFGHFVAREAAVDEEYWTAAWLRAESQYEGQVHNRYVDNYKRKFAEQEYNTLKRRCGGQLTAKCTCIVAVKEDGAKRTILNSIVGTLDISIRNLHHGESFPGEHVKPGIQHLYQRDTERYAYVANVCVAKFARRQGIASNMLQLAKETAKESGARQVFIHVDKNNKAAQQLYEKMGFQIVEKATPHLLAEQQYLMCFDTQTSPCHYHI
ncbi:hypothetical protein EJ110_NYTH05409 [Nymphaea thermarum]|nr:hypothetical protein EJ110_NYTH05409 [Nymphaea thermarum]